MYLQLVFYMYNVCINIMDKRLEIRVFFVHVRSFPLFTDDYQVISNTVLYSKKIQYSFYKETCQNFKLFPNICM